MLELNGVLIHHEETGNGEPLVLVHGSWSDASGWAGLVPALAERFRVIAYDRRGHSRSRRPPGQGSVHEDVADLAALIEALGAAPAHLVGNSFGGAIVLRLATGHPELCRSVSVHEPPLFPLLAGDPAMAGVLEDVGRRAAAVVALLERGETEAGARRFVETIAFGPGAWDAFPPERRLTFIVNAPTWLDETQDPEALQIDLEALRAYDGPALVTTGDQSPPFFPAVADRVAGALRRGARLEMAGAGHVPHMTHPGEYGRLLVDFAGAPM